jgi:hypothetical protein
MRQPGRKRRWLWALAALPLVLPLAVLGYAAWALYDPVTRMPPAEALPLTLSAGDRQSLLDLYSPDPEKRAKAAVLAGQLALNDPHMAAQLVPFMIGMLGDCDSPARPRPAFSAAYLKSLWTPTDVVMHDFYYFCNPPRRPDAAAARSLATIEEPAIGPLIRVLHESRRAVARHSAVRALGCIDNPRSREAVLAALKDSSWEVRFGALVGIRDSMRNCKEGFEAFHKEAIAGILLAARDECPEVRKAAARALWDEDSPSAREATVALLHDREAAVRKEAAADLYNQGVWGVEQLISVMRDPDKTVRDAAARQLIRTRSPATAETLRNALMDDDAFVRKTAAEALSVPGAPE